MQKNRFYRKNARESLKGRWLKASLMLMAFLLAYNILNRLAGSLSDRLLSVISNQNLRSVLATGVNWMVVQPLFAAVFTGVYRMGLEMHRGANPAFSMLILPGKTLIKAMKLMCAMYIRAFGPALLLLLATAVPMLPLPVRILILPALLASIAWMLLALTNYAMAKHLLLTRPELTVSELLAQSRRHMKGFRWKYAVLILSISLWAILPVTAVGYLNSDLASVAARVLFNGANYPWSETASAAFFTDLEGLKA